MSYKVLYRKYRPIDFENIVGQDYTVDMLKNAISSGKSAHAYIFTGPRGTGKTSSAKVFAKALNCMNPVDGNPCNECKSCVSFNDSPDIIEIDAASNNGVDEIRELINNVKLVPSELRYKVYIIDEVHMLTASAFNALLLTLEEPPSHVVFILATTDIQDVPITILSRCQRFDFKPVNTEAIINRLKYVCKEEKIKISEDALEEIALISAGGMRDALGMLDQLYSDDSEITLDIVSDYFGSVSIKKIRELLTALEDNNANKLLEILADVRSSGTNYTVFIEKIISELRKYAIAIKSGDISHNILFDDIYNLIFDLNECLSNININIDPYVFIEIVLLKYIKLGNKIISWEIKNDNENNSNIVEEKDEKEIKNLVENSVKKVEFSLDCDDLRESNDDIVINDDTEKKVVINNHISNIDLNIRINNCFVDASKTMKSNISKSWVDFMNFLMKKDRSLVSLLADSTILAASSSYVLIQSKIDSTNELINNSICYLESLYSDFSGNKYRFAAINEDLWSKETEKYRFNLKNKIKYSYIEEEDSSDGSGQVEEVSDEMEAVAMDVFGSFEVE